MKKLMFTIAMAAALEGFASFSYQGALKLADGSPVTDRNVTLEFRIYDAPGNDAKVLWAGQQAVVVSPSNGLFNVEIGSSMTPVDPFGNENPPPLIDDILARSKDLYIGLTVKDSSGEIRPRQRILPVPTASFALNVNKASDNFTVSSNLLVNGATEIKGTTRLSGDVIVPGKLKIGSSETEVMPVPIGGIIMWSQKSPPDGEENWADNNNACHWAICDGTKVNGVQTPNLADRFVVGTTPKGFFNKYQLGETGGSNEVTLTAAQMPVHTHLYRQDVDLQGPVSGWNVNPGQPLTNVGTGFKGSNGDYGRIVRTGTAGGDSGDHQIGTENSPHENRPPYYALYYIMRVR